MPHRVKPLPGLKAQAGCTRAGDTHSPPPPTPCCSSFFPHLLAANQPQLAGFSHWLFHPGMLFQAPQQWWGQAKPRPTPHEGLDLCWFMDLTGHRRSLDQTTLIPAPFAGRVIQLSPDFLGQSIYLIHDQPLADGRLLLAAFGHTLPSAALSAGSQVGQGDVIAAIAPAGRRRTTVPPHVHITLAMLSPDYAPADLSWPQLGSSWWSAPPPSRSSPPAQVR